MDSLSDHTPDCVVLDLHMPEMDGFEVQSRLGQGSFRFPVVVITGRDAPEDRERMKGRGVAAFLQKPLDGEALLAAINCATKRIPPNPSPKS